MIIVVILIAAITTIIAASVDLSRMAVYKQSQSEREAKWQYCVESGQAFVVEDLVALADTTQSFAKTVNGINLAVSCSPDSFWNSGTSTLITVTGSLDGKSRTTRDYVGKRTKVNPCQFAMYFTTTFAHTIALNVTGDVYMAGTIDASRLTLAGDLYCPNVTAPILASHTGSYVGRQPGQSIVLDSAKYLAEVISPTSGTLTLNNPTGVGTLIHSDLRHHTGDLTVSGTATGEITIFVNGNVTIDNLVESVLPLGRLVVICKGNVTLLGSRCDVFVICDGDVDWKCDVVNGSVSGSTFTKSKPGSVMNFDSYFVSTPSSGFRYYIPGQW